MMKYLPYYYALEQLSNAMIAEIQQILEKHEFADFILENPIRLSYRCHSPYIESVSLETDGVSAIVVTDDLTKDIRHEFKAKLEHIPADTVFSILRSMVLYVEIGVFTRPIAPLLP